MKKRVLQGMRPTGRLHLGNYLGTAKGMVALQENPEYDTYYMVADLHGMTTPFDAKKISEDARNVVIDYLSVGLDPVKSAIFIQSQLADLHAELMFYFSTVVNVARMNHLPTFKEKVKQHPENVTMALLNYPVLMAADILIYKASMVPVGIDQEPHLEVAREIARKMNEIYGTDFAEPKRFERKGGYIPSLTGEGKMSKSVKGSFINLTDGLEEIKKKLAGAPTDSGRGRIVTSNKRQATSDKEYISANGEGSTGVANLLTFVELFEGKEKRINYEREYTGEGIRYGDLKKELAEAIFKELEPIQKRRRKLEGKSKYVDQVIKDGAGRARKIAAATVAEVREKMGIK